MPQMPHGAGRFTATLKSEFWGLLVGRYSSSMKHLGWVLKPAIQPQNERVPKIFPNDFEALHHLKWLEHSSPLEQVILIEQKWWKHEDIVVAPEQMAKRSNDVTDDLNWFHLIATAVHCF